MARLKMARLKMARLKPHPQTSPSSSSSAEDTTIQAGFADHQGGPLQRSELKVVGRID